MSLRFWRRISGKYLDGQLKENLQNFATNDKGENIKNIKFGFIKIQDFN